MTHARPSWSDGYVALYERAVDVRGADDDGPCTTNRDALDIAAVIAPQVLHNLGGHLARRWSGVLTELEQHALGAAPDQVYAHNRELWDVVESVCKYLAHTPAPELWSQLANCLGEASHRNRSPSDGAPFAQFEAKTYDDLWEAQRKYLATARGVDELPPPPGFGLGSIAIPRTTNRDVLQLATYWSEQLARAKQVMGYAGVVAKWQQATADVDRIAKPGAPDTVYSKNNELWRTAHQVAVQIAIADEAPGRWEMFVGALGDSAVHLPDTLAHAAGKGVDLVASAAHAVGTVANAAGKGLFSGFGAPVLIGAGLVGLFLVTRSRDREEGE